MLDCAKYTVVTRRDKADSLEPELFRPGAERFSKLRARPICSHDIQRATSC